MFFVHKTYDFHQFCASPLILRSHQIFTIYFLNIPKNYHKIPENFGQDPFHTLSTWILRRFEAIFFIFLQMCRICRKFWSHFSLKIYLFLIAFWSWFFIQKTLIQYILKPFLGHWSLKKIWVQHKMLEHHHKLFVFLCSQI